MRMEQNIIKKLTNKSQNNKMKIILFYIVISIFCACSASAQQGIFVPKDYRIAKFELNILQFLISKKQLGAEKSPVKLENFQGRFMVMKCIEIFSQDTTSNLLLIRFRATSDHGDVYWGIVSNNEKYFFYSLKDLDFEAFKRKNPDQSITISFYCEHHKLLSPGITVK